MAKRKERTTDSQSIFTSETFGVILALFSTLCLVCLITRDKIFSAPGLYVNYFLFGIFGYFAYFVIGFTAYIGVTLIIGKNFGFSLKRKTLLTVSFVLIALLVQVITLKPDAFLFYGEYLSKAYTSASEGIVSCSGGGIITALLAYPLSKLLTAVGSYVVLASGIAVSVFFLVKDIIDKREVSSRPFKDRVRSSYIDVKEPAKSDNLTDIPNTEEETVTGTALSENENKPKQRLFVDREDEFSFKSRRDLKDTTKPGIKLQSVGNLSVGNSYNSYSGQYESELRAKINYIKTPAEIHIDETGYNSNYNTETSEGTKVSSPILRNTDDNKIDIPLIEHVEEELTKNSVSESTSESGVKPESVIDSAERFSRNYVSIEDTEEIKPEEPSAYEKSQSVFDEVFGEEKESVNSDTLQPERIQNETEDTAIDNSVSERRSVLGDRSVRGFFRRENSSPVSEPDKKDERAYISRVVADGNGKEEQKTEEPVKKGGIPDNFVYVKPPVDLLETYDMEVDESLENHSERMDKIRSTLEDFHISVTTKEYVQGPRITRYAIEMPSDISVKNVFKYDMDLKMRLASEQDVRIAPISGTNLVGVEVANRSPVTVGLKSILSDMEKEEFGKSSLMFALGKNVVGTSIYDDLAKGPHYLVAGTTGSGKSICLHAMLTSLIMRYSPEDLRIALIDPKVTEFKKYEHIPHLLVDEIIYDIKKVLALFSWAYEEMERRNKMFSEYEVGDIKSFNANVAGKVKGVKRLPRILILADELSDLMLKGRKELDEKICAIAQKARSAGIHLVLATQYPTTQVISGPMKINLPSRIALKVNTSVESTVMTNSSGAEKLLGNGDMLYKNMTMPTFERYQGAFISEREIKAVVNFIKENNECYYDEELAAYLDRAVSKKEDESEYSNGKSSEISDDNKGLFKKALELGISSGTISISQLQRRFQIGYGRAGGLIDKMERMGYISQNEGSKARKVLITREEFENMYGDQSN